MREPGCAAHPVCWLHPLPRPACLSFFVLLLTLPMWVEVPGPAATLIEAEFVCARHYSKLCSNKSLLGGGGVVSGTFLHFIGNEATS